MSPTTLRLKIPGIRPEQVLRNIGKGILPLTTA